MKKFIATLALAAVSLTLVCVPAISRNNNSGQAAIRLMERYDDEEGVEYLRIGSFLLGIAKSFVTGEEKEIIKYLDDMAIFSAEDATAEVQERFLKELDSAMEGYQKLLEVKEDGDDMTIYFLKKDEDTVAQMMLVTRSEASVIYMNGKIPVAVLKKMAAE